MREDSRVIERIAESIDDRAYRCHCGPSRSLTPRSLSLSCRDLLSSLSLLSTLLVCACVCVLSLARSFARSLVHIRGWVWDLENRDEKTESASSPLLSDSEAPSVSALLVSALLWQRRQSLIDRCDHV